MAATKQTDTRSVPGSPYQVPPEPNRWPSIGLAVGVHAMLLAFLWIGVSWQNNEPVAVEAEVWDVNTQTAAPPPPTPAPQPDPEPEPDTPPPQPVEAPPPPVEQPVPRQPDIALEREQKRKEELKRRQDEERLEHERELAEQKRADDTARALAEKKAQDAADRKAQQLADKKAAELAEKKEREAAEKARAEQEKKDAEKKKKDDADKKKKDDADKKKKAADDQKKLDAARADEMRRITGAAGNGSTGSTGTAAKSTAPRIDKGYVAAITAVVKSNTAYAGDTGDDGNPTATFRVEQLPTGDIMSVKMVKSSGVPAFDDAVKNGISKSSPLPKKKDGTVERTLVIEFHMKDMK